MKQPIATGSSAWYIYICITPRIVNVILYNICMVYVAHPAPYHRITLLEYALLCEYIRRTIKQGISTSRMHFRWQSIPKTAFSYTDKLSHRAIVGTLCMLWLLAPAWQLCIRKAIYIYMHQLSWLWDEFDQLNCAILWLIMLGEAVKFIQLCYQHNFDLFH